MKFVGQSIIQWDLRQTNADELAAFGAELMSGNPDVIFTDLELTINDGTAVPADRARGSDANNHHEAGPWVLDLLKDELGFNMLTHANNHAWDLRLKGLLATLDGMNSRGIANAGSGHNLSEALRGTYLHTDQGHRTNSMVGVVSAPTLYKYGGISTATEAGVNAMQITNDTRTLLPDMHANNMRAVSLAANHSDITISYHHNHYFEPIPGTALTDEMYISDWWRNWAHETIDLGADIYLSHGSTLLHGIELYKDRILFYGLGNCFFQTRKGNTAYEEKTWESIMAEVCFHREGSVKFARFHPVLLNEQGTEGTTTPLDYDNSHTTEANHKWFQTRGLPHISRTERGLEILHRLAELSDAVIEVDDANFVAHLDVPRSQGKGPKHQSRGPATNDDTGEHPLPRHGDHSED